ncbi:MAG: hypothetical protein QGI04_05420, partial [Candidatus Poseidoniia archaeon]|nr:hypothetical protein [Candidatus Poseidoniia archaeon]
SYLTNSYRIAHNNSSRSASSSSGTTDGTVDLTSSTYAIVVFGFTLIWVVRSAAIKYFSQ